VDVEALLDMIVGALSEMEKGLWIMQRCRTLMLTRGPLQLINDVLTPIAENGVFEFAAHVLEWTDQSDSGVTIGGRNELRRILQAVLMERADPRYGKELVARQDFH